MSSSPGGAKAPMSFADIKQAAPGDWRGEYDVVKGRVIECRAAATPPTIAEVIPLWG